MRRVFMYLSVCFFSAEYYDDDDDDHDEKDGDDVKLP